MKSFLRVKSGTHPPPSIQKMITHHLIMTFFALLHQEKKDGDGATGPIQG